MQCDFLFKRASLDWFYITFWRFRRFSRIDLALYAIYILSNHFTKKLIFHTSCSCLVWWARWISSPFYHPLETILNFTIYPVTVNWLNYSSCWHTFKNTTHTYIYFLLPKKAFFEYKYTHLRYIPYCQKEAFFEDKYGQKKNFRTVKTTFCFVP